MGIFFLTKCKDYKGLELQPEDRSHCNLPHLIIPCCLKVSFLSVKYHMQNYVFQTRFLHNKVSLKDFNYLGTFQLNPPKRELEIHWLVCHVPRQAHQVGANSAFQLLTARAEQALIKANSRTRDSKGSGRQKELMYLNIELASRKQAKMLTFKEPGAGGIYNPLESPQMGQFLCMPKIYT